MKLGLIKWFGGYDNKRNSYKHYGVIDRGYYTVEGTTVFFHVSGIAKHSRLNSLLSDEVIAIDSYKSDLYTGYPVAYEEQFNSQKGRWEAENVQLLFELPNDVFTKNYQRFLNFATGIKPSILVRSIPNPYKMSIEKLIIFMKAMGREAYRQAFVSHLSHDFLLTTHIDEYVEDNALERISAYYQHIYAERKDFVYTIPNLQLLTDSEREKINNAWIYNVDDVDYIFKYTPKRKLANATDNDRLITHAIWAYKDVDDDNFPKAFATFTVYLREALKAIAMSYETSQSFALIAVPRHSDRLENTIALSIKAIVNELNQDPSLSSVFYDESDYLYRFRNVKSVHSDNSNRLSVGEHMDTMGHGKLHCPESSILIIIDDVTTQGNTLEACRNIVSDSVNGQNTIKRLVIARTSAAKHNNDSIVWFD